MSCREPLVGDFKPHRALLTLTLFDPGRSSLSSSVQSSATTISCRAAPTNKAHDRDARVAQQRVDWLDRMLRVEAPGVGKTAPDRMHAERRSVEKADNARCERQHPCSVNVVAQKRRDELVHTLQGDSCRRGSAARRLNRAISTRLLGIAMHRQRAQNAANVLQNSEVSGRALRHSTPR